jgi:proline iminopeptidase
MRATTLAPLLVAPVLAFCALAVAAPRPTLTNGSKLAVPGGQIWYRVVGAGSGIPVILLHGGPGNPSVYLKSLEALGDERVVVRYDQLGGGYSDVVHDTLLFTIRHFVEELELLRRHLALERMHVYGHSWGATLALEYYRAHPRHVASLILASETLDLPAFFGNVRRLFDEMPDSMARAVRLNRAGEPHDTTAYRAAMKEFRGHFTRTPVPAEMDTLMKLMNPEIATYMNGTNPFTPNGTLREYNATPFLSQVKVPVLFLVGEVDVAGPEIVKRHASLTPGAKLVTIPNAAHHIQWDNATATLGAVRSFLRDADARR